MVRAQQPRALPLLDVRSSRSASATVSECRHGAIQPGHDVGGRQSGALFSCAATISGAGLGGGAAISTGGILLQRCVDQQLWLTVARVAREGCARCIEKQAARHSVLETGRSGARCDEDKRAACQASRLSVFEEGAGPAKHSTRHRAASRHSSTKLTSNRPSSTPSARPGAGLATIRSRRNRSASTRVYPLLPSGGSIQTTYTGQRQASGFGARGHATPRTRPLLNDAPDAPWKPHITSGPTLRVIVCALPDTPDPAAPQTRSRASAACSCCSRWSSLGLR